MRDWEGKTHTLFMAKQADLLQLEMLHMLTLERSQVDQVPILIN
jgi:hypothetical protein